MDEIRLVKQSVDFLYRENDGGSSDDAINEAEEVRAELHVAYHCENDGCWQCKEFWADEDINFRMAMAKER